MSSHNICFHGEIRKILCGYSLLSVAHETHFCEHSCSVVIMVISEWLGTVATACKTLKLNLTSSTLYYFLLYMYDQRLYCLVTELLDGRMYQQSTAQTRLCEWAWQSGLHFSHTFHIFS